MTDFNVFAVDGTFHQQTRSVLRYDPEVCRTASHDQTVLLRALSAHIRVHSAGVMFLMT